MCLADTVAHAPLAVGDTAWCIITEKSGAARATVLDAALVRVEAIEGEAYRVRVLRGGLSPAGHPHTCARWQLYARRDSGERAAFGVVVRRSWGGDYHGEARR